MEPTSNQTNIQPLKDAFRSVERGTLRIASGWIRSRQLHEVLDETVVERIRSGAVALRLLLRIGSPKDVEITDPGVFRLLENLSRAAGADVQWRYSSHHHSKVYIAADRWAMVGSFNLTGGGFGSEDAPGTNPEAGVITTDGGEVAALAATFDAQFAAAAEVPDALVAVVANAAAHDRLAAFALKPVAAGTFVEIPLGTPQESVLAQVERAVWMHPSFFAAGDTAAELDPQLFRQFGGGDELGLTVRGVAWSQETAWSQVLQLELKPIRRIIRRAGSAAPAAPRFEPVTLPPAVGSLVSLADEELLAGIFNPAGARYAYLEENPTVAVSFDNREIRSKHMAVLGSTGSGKSYFVKRFIERSLAAEAAAAVERLATPAHEASPLRIVIVDTHGEYGSGAFAEDLAVAEILADESRLERAGAVLVSDADDVDEVIKEVGKHDLAAIGHAFARAESATDAAARTAAFVTALEEEIANRRASAHAALDWPALLEEIAEDVAAEEKKPSNDPIRAGAWQYRADLAAVSGIADTETRRALEAMLTARHTAALQSAVGAPKAESVSTDGLQATIAALESGRLRLETFDLVGSIEQPGVYRLNLAPVHDAEIRQAIVGDLMKEVFERAKERAAGGGFATLFVVDEAQNYAPERASRSVASYRWMKVLASEGRKFGVGLLVMTQRPAYLSKDVLAQCNSQAIFRLVNPQDISQVEGTVEGISEYDLAALPNFVAGQAIFTGVAMTMPVRVRVAE